MASGEARFGFCAAVGRSPSEPNTDLMRTHQNVHLIEHSIRSNKIMGNAHSVGLHRVRGAVRVESHRRFLGF
jgi:hypothetical protein